MAAEKSTTIGHFDFIVFKKNEYASGGSPEGPAFEKLGKQVY